MPDPTQPPEAIAAAAFLNEAIGLEGDPADIAAELIRVGDEPPVATFAVELDSAAGPVAFLIYVHDLAAVGATGATGRELMTDALETLAEAERLGAPGPRAVASAEVDRWGLLLATTPSAYARLAGDAADQPTDGVSPTSAPRDVSAPELAEALLSSLRETNRLANAYIAARQPEPPASPAEAELALYLTDSRSLTPLLSLVRQIVAGTGEGT